MLHLRITPCLIILPCFALACAALPSDDDDESDDESADERESSIGASSTLQFASYIGGVQQEQTRDVTTDAAGNVFVTGGSWSPQSSFGPWTAAMTGYDKTWGGMSDAYVLKFDPTGNIVAATYVGGSNYDRAYAIEVDKDGEVYIGGRAGLGFPVSPGAAQTTFGGDNAPVGGYGKQDAFVCKFSNDLKTRRWCTYLGGLDHGFARDIAIEDVPKGQAPNVYVALSAVDLPLPSGLISPGAPQPSHAGLEDGALVKLSANGSSVLWGTYVGGSGNDGTGPAVRVDGANNVYYEMQTDSSDAPKTAGVVQPNKAAGMDLHVSKYTPSGARVWATYYGGAGKDQTETHGLAVTAAGEVYVAGMTNSTTVPGSAGGYQPSSKGALDMFVARISADGTTAVASFLGGSSNDAAQGIALDSLGNVVLSGHTASSGAGAAGFPVTPTAKWPTPGSTTAGATDGVAVAFSPNLASLLYSTRLPGNQDDSARAVAVDKVNGDTWLVVGQTDSSNFPTKNAWHPAYAAVNGELDGFVVRLSP